MDKILYFGYVVLTSFKHRKKLLDFSRYYHTKYHKSVLFFLRESYSYYIKYSMHPLDYFYFDVYSNPSFDPQKYASTLFMYRYHKRLNDPKYTQYFFNKMLFHEKFRFLMGHDFINLSRVKETELRNWIISKDPDALMAKKMKSVGGFGVKKIYVGIQADQVYLNKRPLEKSFTYLRKFDMLEEFVVQHDLLNKLNPGCLNTVRVVTVLDNEQKAQLIGAVIRLGVNSDVDNFHSGGIAVNVNLETGKLEGNGFKLAPEDPNCFTEHPVTHVVFDGYQLPFWSKLLDTVQKACFVIPQVRTVGWDVAIRQNGISLIEGNHDWDKIIIEKALKRGIRKDLEKYL
ncbi:MAG: sugar-transfer associated ATP-grasp domain-containing protein [Paludibacter sp.]|nr:sugar-transfer associated ATP-grasp domain-containing protein [Paludibacter sp.]